MWIEIFIKEKNKQESLIDFPKARPFDVTALSILQKLIKTEWKNKVVFQGPVDWHVEVSKQDILFYLNLIQQEIIDQLDIMELEEKINTLDQNKKYLLIGEES